MLNTCLDVYRICCNFVNFRKVLERQDKFLERLDDSNSWFIFLISSFHLKHLKYSGSNLVRFLKLQRNCIAA